MKLRYRLFRRSSGIFFIEDRTTRKQESLRTRNKEVARRLAAARNEAHAQPALNLQIARAYLAAADAGYIRRTWSEVMVEFVRTKTDVNRTRSERALSDRAYEAIKDLALIETRPEHFLHVLEEGGVSTNNYLRRFHNFALEMGWLAWPVMPKRRWPAVRYREKRPITREEHEKILERETNPEMRAFLWCCWHLGGSQSDIARLTGEDVDWSDRVVGFFRAKTGTVQIVHFGEGLAQVLQDLPSTGLLFPRLAMMDEKHRASLFQRACRRVKVSGVSLHSYRYSWAVRARESGYPERFAQEALGHRSKAVHRAYARKAQVRLPSLEEYERGGEKMRQ